jgi:hypothetical protein
MIQAMYNQRLEVLERPPGQTAAGSANFAELFGDATKTATQGAALSAAFADSVSGPVSPVPAAETSLGDPDVQGWLNSYYAERGAASAANTSYQPATGAGNNFPAGSVYGPDAIYAQALANQVGNSYASLTGDNAAEFTSQLPGIPSQPAQQEFDRRLALENLQRLESGQPIDTTAYWSDPGAITTGGHTYTSQELGYAGPGQSSGPQPIYISIANQIQGTDTFSVPGYTGTVTGIQPGRYYTLQQLEQAGLKSGQPDAQFHPGSWSTTQNA